MIEHAWSVLCQKVIIDQESNNISLDVIEEIHLEGNLPPEAIRDSEGFLVPYQLIFASLWYRNDPEIESRGKARLQLISPNGKVIGGAEIDVDLTKNSRLRTKCKFNSLPIPKNQSGYFFFHLQVQEKEWKTVAKIPLEIKLSLVESGDDKG